MFQYGFRNTHNILSDIAECFKDTEKKTKQNGTGSVFYPFRVPPSSAQHLRVQTGINGKDAVHNTRKKSAP